MQDHTSGGTVEQRRSVLTTLALGLSTFLILFDVTAVVVAMPAIAKDVGLGVAGDHGDVVETLETHVMPSGGEVGGSCCWRNYSR